MVAMLWWPLILALPLPFTRAGPTPSASLTDHITDVAPTCAHACILNFIHNNFPIQVCTPQNFNCLCINPTTTGYTLGEATVTCLYSSCNGDDSKAGAVYNICNNIPGAQPNTHPSLTASFLGPVISDGAGSTSSRAASLSTESTSSTQSSSDTSSASSSTVSSSESSSSTSRSTTTDSSSSTSSSSSSGTMSTSSSTAASSTQAAATTPSSTSSFSLSSSTTSASATAAPAAASLSKSQVAGVVIASVGVGALAFGFCFFLICYRRRNNARKRRQSDASWGEKLPPSRDSIAEYDEPVPRAPEPPVVSPPMNRPPLRVLTPSQNGWQNWTRNSNPHGIGLALAPDTRQEPPPRPRGGPSPMTPYSQRTQSQLLPDRPHYNMQPAIARSSLNRQSRSLHAPIPAYRPDRSPPMSGPKFPSTIDTSQANLQGIHRTMSDPFYNEARSPPIDYRGVPHTPYVNPAVRPPSIIRVGDASSVIPRGVPPPTIPESNEVPPMPVAGLTRLKSQKNPHRKKSASSSRYTRFSSGSATSFEDIDEEQTPLHSAATPIESYFVSPTSDDEIPPLPVKSAKRSSHIINRPHPTRSQRKKKDVPELNVDTQSRDVTQTAKWKILVSPGLQSLDESLPTTPKTPKTPLMAGETPTMSTTDRLPRPTYRMSDFR